MRSLIIGRVASTAIVVTALAVAYSCTEKITPPEPQSSGPTTNVVPDSVQSIFTAHCATSGCHVTGAAFGGEVLEAAVAYQTTVNVPAVEMAALMRIWPSQPDSSYLVKKVRGDSDIVGGRMPLGQTPLSAAQIATIVNWVAEGALPTVVPAAPATLLP